MVVPPSGESMAILNQIPMEKNSLRTILFLGMSLWLLVFTPACSDEISDLVGPSTSGFSVGIKAIYGSGGLPNDGTSQATIRVEVFDQNNQGANTTATLTTTRGTLGTTSLTISNGVGVTTLTSSTTTGTATIVATVENVSASTIVPIVNISTAASG